MGGGRAGEEVHSQEKTERGMWGVEDAETEAWGRRGDGGHGRSNCGGGLSSQEPQQSEPRLPGSAFPPPTGASPTTQVPPGPSPGPGVPCCCWASYMRISKMGGRSLRRRVTTGAAPPVPRSRR